MGEGEGLADMGEGGRELRVARLRFGRGVERAGHPGKIERAAYPVRFGVDHDRAENLETGLAAVRAKRPARITLVVAPFALHSANATGMFPSRCSMVGGMTTDLARAAARMDGEFPGVDWDTILATPPADDAKCRKALLDAGVPQATIDAVLPAS